jgi:hypothetical protein
MVTAVQGEHNSHRKAQSNCDCWKSSIPRQKPTGHLDILSGLCAIIACLVQVHCTCFAMHRFPYNANRSVSSNCSKQQAHVQQLKPYVM